MISERATSFRLAPRLRAGLDGIEAYATGRGRAGMLRLDANEGPAAPRDLLEELLAESARNVVLYPEYDEIRSVAAETYGVTPESVMPVCGADEGIRLVTQAFCGPDAPALVSFPSFSMYERYAALAGASALRVPLVDLDDDIEGLVSACSRAALLVLASPASPSGRRLPEDAVRTLLAALDGRPLLLDETYAEFCGQDFVPLVAEHANLIVLRTLSKSHGVPGLRLGFVIAVPDLVERLSPLRSPYNVSAVAASVGVGLLRRDTRFGERLERAVRARADLQKRLATVGIEASRSDTHFCVVRLGNDAADAVVHLASKGILVRDLSGCLPGAIRVSVTCGSDADRLIEVLAPWLASRRGQGRNP